MPGAPTWASCRIETYQAHMLRDRRSALVALAVSRRLPRGAFPRLGPTRMTLMTELLCDLSHRDRLQPLFRRLAVDALRAGSEVLFYPAYDPPMHETLARAGFFSAERVLDWPAHPPPLDALHDPAVDRTRGRRVPVARDAARLRL